MDCIIYDIGESKWGGTPKQQNKLVDTRGLCPTIPSTHLRHEFKILIWKDMTKQANNCLDLYRGGNPSTIKQLLQMQRSSVVNELKEHFGASDLDTLAVKLSLG